MHQDETTISLGDMLERERIRHNLARYSRGMDRQDADLIKASYWPEGWDDHGVFIGTGAEFGEWLKPVWPTMKMDHLLGQSYIELQGNFANVETYFLAYHRAGAEPTQDMFLGGRYVDRLEKRGEQWKFIQRVAVYDWYRKTGESHSWKDPWWDGMDLQGRCIGKQAEDYSWELFANVPIRRSERLQSHNSVTKPAT